MSKIISVFGSSAPLSGSTDYETARTVGRLLAEAGYAVATGGYGGTMAAVSQGAAEASGQVIGVTSEQIESFRIMGANQWVTEEIRYETLQERLLHLVNHNDGMIALPGGIGTLSEMTLAWSFLQVGEIPTRPFALLGRFWHGVVEALYDPAYIRETHKSLLYLADSPEVAVAHMAQ